MIVDKLLSQLEKVKRKGDNSWLACCPAHDDKNPSLGITEKDERVLLRCFSHQCDVSDIVHAVGLELSDLFPPPWISVVSAGDFFSFVVYHLVPR